jgi:ribose 5-phosphate isomerase
MKIELNKDLVKEILVQETFYNTVPEFFFLKDAGAQIVEAMSRDGGCTTCTENNLINPTTMGFIAHAVNMYFDCGIGSLTNFKNFMRKFKNIEGDFSIALFYKESDEADIAEILI